jgi:hypothetical protein
VESVSLSCGRCAAIEPSIRRTRDEAFECLDRAVRFRDHALVHLAVTPQWDSLRGDPRFGERLTTMGLPHPG